jgi:hypothetical protein
MYEWSISIESINSMNVRMNEWSSSNNSCGWIGWISWVSKEFMRCAIRNNKNAEKKEKFKESHIQK